MRKILILTVVLLSACSSIPLSTMVKMSSFDKDDFINLQADAIGLKITINDTIPLAEAAINLAVEIKDDDGSLNLLFPVEVIKVEHKPAATSIFRSRPAYNVSHFRLSSEGIDNFKKIQALIETKDNLGITFSVNIGNTNLGIARVEDVYLSIDLKLYESKGYMTLIDEWKMEVDLVEDTEKDSQKTGI